MRRNSESREHDKVIRLIKISSFRFYLQPKAIITDAELLSEICSYIMINGRKIITRPEGIITFVPELLPNKTNLFTFFQLPCC